MSRWMGVGVGVGMGAGMGMGMGVGVGMGVGQSQTQSQIQTPSEASGADRALGERVVGDLLSTLQKVCRWGPDFYRPGGGGGPRLVPEKVFCAMLGSGLCELGWTVEREAVQGSGRTDLKLTRRGQVAVVEVKIWGRNDYRQIQRQVEDYWAPDVRVGAVVMIQEGHAESFVADYRARCLSDPGLTVAELPVCPPILRRFRVESTTGLRYRAQVEHLLVRIPGGRRRSPQRPTASIAAW